MTVPGLIPNGKRHGPGVFPINDYDENDFYRLDSTVSDILDNHSESQYSDQIAS